VECRPELDFAGIRTIKRRWDGHTPIRLIGLGVSGVVKDNEPDQLELFQDPDSRKKKVEQAVIGIKKRWSGVKLTRASLLEQSEIRHPGQIKGGPAGTKPASHRETDSWPVQ